MLLIAPSHQEKYGWDTCPSPLTRSLICELFWRWASLNRFCATLLEEKIRTLNKYIGEIEKKTKKNDISFEIP